MRGSLVFALVAMLVLAACVSAASPSPSPAATGTPTPAQAARVPTPVAVTLDPAKSALLVLDLTAATCTPRRSCVASLQAVAALLQRARDAKALVAAAKEIGEIVCVQGDVRRDARKIVGRIDRLDVLDPDVRLWLPLAFSPQERSDERRHSNNWSYLARLKPGASVEQARQQIDALNTRNLDRFPELKQVLVNAGFHTVVVPFHEELVRKIRGTLYLLWGGAAFVRSGLDAVRLGEHLDRGVHVEAPPVVVDRLVLTHDEPVEQLPVCRAPTQYRRRIVTGDDWRREDVQERYRGHLSPFINRRIERLMKGSLHDI